MNKINGKKIYLLAIFSKVSIIFISLLSSVFINRLLGTELKGEYTYVKNIIDIIIPILSMGIGQTYSTYKRKYGDNIYNYFVSLSFFQSLFSLFICIIVYLSTHNYYLSFAFLISSSSILRANILYIAAIEDVKRRDFNNIFYKLLYLVMVFLIYIFKIKSLNIALLLLSIDDLIIICGTFKSYKFKVNFKNLNNKIKIKNIYKLAFTSMLMNLMISLNYSLDVIFLKKMTSNSLVGLYGVGIQLANMFWIIPDAFKDVIANKTARKDSVEEIVLVIKMCIYIALIIIIIFIIFGKKIICFMYGSEFVDSYIPTVILFFGCICMIIYKLIHPLYIAKGKQLKVLIILTVSVVINVISNIIVIPKYSIYGAALSSVLSYSVCGGLFLYVFSKEYSIRISDILVFKKEEIIKITKILKKKIYISHN